MDPNEVLVATEEWKTSFPGALAGALVMSRVDNPQHNPALETRKRELEAALRAESSQGLDRKSHVRAYRDYYRAHGKTYHVEAQWRSVAVEGTAIPSRAALVEAMVMAELRTSC